MKSSHTRFWGTFVYVLLVLVVLVLLFLPQECQHVRDTALAAGLRALQNTAGWLLDIISRGWLILSGVGLLTLYLYGYLSFRNRITDMESRLRWLEVARWRAEQGANANRLNQNLAAPPSTASQCNQHSPCKNGSPIVPVQQPKCDEVRQPAEQLSRFLEATRRCKHLRIKPELAGRPWQMGFACQKGNVRPQNQDYGFSFLIGGRQVLILADGCGGTPHGQRAAYLAVVEAACSVAKTFGGASWQSCDPQLVAQQALLDASSRLVKEGAKFGLLNPEDGLRTTLIVLIANNSDVGHAYIGDGGGCIVRTSGAVERFLTPQKASPDQPNVLAASLGPQMQGEPVVGTIRRQAGDLVLVGTDGVFDRVEESFPKDVLRAAIQFNGDLGTTAERIIEELAAKQDELGFICDDNLTLGIMGDGSAPVLAAGFWAAQKVPDKQDQALKVGGASDVQSR
jgi:serine/threonine protein phosphatase PrpC